MSYRTGDDRVDRSRSFWTHANDAASRISSIRSRLGPRNCGPICFMRWCPLLA